MRIGSLFSGIGGLDVACERAFEARTAWQLDLVGADVRRRHWPDALQVEADVRVVDPLSLPPVDILCGGFPCVDLSCAGPQPENPLDTGDRSGLYQEIIRFAREIRPQYVVVENVLKLRRLLPRVSCDFRGLGYGLSWCVCEAADAGAPHLRRRVFLLAERGAIGRGEVAADASGRWTPDGDRTWTTITASEDKGRSTSIARRADPDILSEQVRLWPTVVQRDYKCGELPSRVGTEALSQAAANGKRLSPEWTETLMGFPVGWTLPTGPRLEVDISLRWPRGRYPATWDRSIPWPGYDWEPARTLPDGPPCPGRPGRIRALGNAVVPAQSFLALRALIP